MVAMMFDAPDGFPFAFTVATAARSLSVSKATVYRAIRRGEIHAVHLGRRLVVPRWELERLLNQNPGVASPPGVGSGGRGGPGSGVPGLPPPSIR